MVLRVTTSEAGAMMTVEAIDERVTETDVIASGIGIEVVAAPWMRPSRGPKRSSGMEPLTTMPGRRCRRSRPIEAVLGGAQQFRAPASGGTSHPPGEATTWWRVGIRSRG